MNENAPTPPPTTLKSGGFPWLGVVALLLVIGAGAGGYLFLGRAQPAPAKPVVAPTLAEAPRPAPAAPAVDYPATDAKLGAAAKRLSAREELGRWLSEPDVLRRLVAAVQLVADGQSPRPMLGFMRPEGPFAVEPMPGTGKKGVPERLVMSPASMARYDLVTQVLASVDAAEVGRLYGELRGALEGAFGDIAPPGHHFDAAFTQAVDRLAAVPIPDGPIEVVSLPTGAGYAFADPQLEALGPAEKHLLRLGPGNARAVVGQLRQFREAVR